MENQAKYKERAKLILEKAVQKQPKLNEKIDNFYADMSTKGENLDKQYSQKFNPSLQISMAYHMGSLSNEVYKVDLKNGNTIIVKHYHDVLKEFVQREIQDQILNQMASKNYYPYVFYKDSFCRVQAFIPGSSINRERLNPKLLKNITKSLANFSKQYEHVAKDKGQAKHRQISSLFDTSKVIYKAKQNQNPDLVYKVAQYVDGILCKKQILQNLKKLLKDHKMMMNHNDSNLSNILVLNSIQSQDPHIQLLDFQFSTFNYMGYDLGNMLNQIAADYGGAYGVDQTGKQHKFQIREDWQVSPDLVKDITKVYFDILQTNQKTNQKTTQEERRHCVKIGRLLSHLYWLFVGLKQIDDPNIDLDMTYYIRRRYQQFMKLYTQMVD